MRSLIGRKWLVRVLFAFVALGGLGVAAAKSEAIPCMWWRESYYTPGTKLKVGECGLHCGGGYYCWGHTTSSAIYVEGPCPGCEEAQR